MAYDLIIVGAGPAGLSAALNAKYLKLESIVLEADRAGGALSQSYPWKEVDSYLGFNEMSGRQIANRTVDHVREVGVEIREMEEVAGIERKGKLFMVRTDKGEYEGKSVILATGIRGVQRKLSVPGEGLEGVSHFVTSTRKFDGKDVVVVGGGNSAADCALGLDEAGAKVCMVHRRDELRATGENRDKILKSKIRMMWNTEVERIEGNGKVERVVLVNNKTKKKETVDAESVAICIGSVPAKDYLEGLGIRMDGAMVKVDADGMTNTPGVFAAGDIVSSIKRITQALATGERAAYGAFKYIRNPYWE
jgi:thioredoxin reductase (NADPH)